MKPLNANAHEWTPSQNISTTHSLPAPSPSHEPRSTIKGRKQRTRRKSNEGAAPRTSKKYSKVQEGSLLNPILEVNEKKSQHTNDDFPSLTKHSAKDTSRREGQLSYLELAQKQRTQPLLTSAESVDVEPSGWFSSRSCRRWDNISKSTPAVDSSSDEDDGVTSIAAVEQQIVSPSVIAYPAACQTSADESAVAR